MDCGEMEAESSSWQFLHWSCE